MRLFPDEKQHVLVRVLWLYGLYTLVYNAAFLVAYYLLPEGLLRGGPATAGGRVVAAAPSFAYQLALTLLFNLGVAATIGLLLNLVQVNGFPVGYLYPISLGVMSGLVSGTNSFVSSDLDKFAVRPGMALALSIGNLEMLGYLCIIAATVCLGVYHYRSWWRWQWKATKVKPLRAVRPTRAEIVIAIAGIALIVIGAVRETMMAIGAS